MFSWWRNRYTLMNTRVLNGDKAEALFLSATVEAGYNISIPFSNACRYDYVLEDKSGKLLKVQVKKSYWKNNRAKKAHMVEVARVVNGKRHKYKEGEYDYLAVVDTQERELWIIPFNVVDNQGTQLRLDTGKFDEYKG